MTAQWTRLAEFARPHWRALVGLALLSAMSVALEALLPWPMKLIVDQVLGGHPMPEYAHWVVSLPGAASTTALLAWLAAGIFVVFLAVRLTSLASQLLQASVSGQIKYTLAGAVFARMQRLSLIFHRRMHKGDLLHRVLNDTDCLPTVVTGAALPALTAIVSLVVFFTIMAKLDLVLACVSLFVAIPMMLFMRILGPRMTERAFEQQEKEGQVWSIAEQSLTSLPVVQAFGREEHERERFQTVAHGSMQASLRTVATQLQFKLGLDGSQAAGAAVLFVLGGWHVYEGQLSLGSLLVFLSYLASLYAPLNTLAYLSSTVASAAGSARRVLKVLDAEDCVYEVADAQPVGRLDGSVRFENVTFGYEIGTPVLRDVNLSIAAGEVVALVGATGAGKTTLVSLIPRLFDPWSGTVSIDRMDLRTMRLADVRGQVSFVLQDTLLLPVSVAENIAYGRPEATRVEIEAAAVAARADEFISNLPRGFDTIIGERGTTLSGGQRQRLAIARALLKDSPILILDEPTSALDVETERMLMQAIEHLMKGRTTIVIAHRLSTIRNADRVLLLRDGHLQELSTQEALRAQTALYAARDERTRLFDGVHS